MLRSSRLLPGICLLHQSRLSLIHIDHIYCKGSRIPLRFVDALITTSLSSHCQWRTDHHVTVECLEGGRKLFSMDPPTGTTFSITDINNSHIPAFIELSHAWSTNIEIGNINLVIQKDCLFYLDVHGSHIFSQIRFIPLTYHR